MWVNLQLTSACLTFNILHTLVGLELQGNSNIDQH